MSGGRRIAMDGSGAPRPLRPGGWSVITGGAGFLGCNIADRLAEAGRRVLVYDNLSRPRVAENLDWLQRRHGARIAAVAADVRDSAMLEDAVSEASEIYHLAAQVAVTTSIAAPLDDFEINARGTLNLLEALRRRRNPPPLLFASTNKVYGDLHDIPLREEATRYRPADVAIHARGIGEHRPLDLYSPYGCSKGTADQYVLDFARIYNLPTAVFRMSCLYGPRQFGTEDQGWVAHFFIAALQGRPITVYGDGKQVRDLLFVSDVVEAFVTAQAAMPKLAGRAFNIGGGPERTCSLLELLQFMHRRLGLCPAVHFSGRRPGDQAYYVSDTRRFQELTGWQPGISVETGLLRLAGWLHEHVGAGGGHAAEGVPA